MDTPITIPLTVHQQALFRAWKQQQQTLTDHINVAVTGIAAGQIDPSVMAAWTVTLKDDRIVFTPPASPLALLPDTPQADVATQ